MTTPQPEVKKKVIPPIPSDQQILSDNVCRMLREVRGYEVKFTQVPIKGLKPLDHKRPTASERKRKPMETDGVVGPGGSGSETKKKEYTFAEIMTTLSPINPQLLAVARNEQEKEWVVVIYDTRKTAIGVAPLRQYADLLRLCGVTHAIVVYESELTPQAQSNSQDFTDPQLGGIIWQFQPSIKLMYPVIDAWGTSLSEKKLTEEEIKHWERKLDMKRTGFPKASISMHPCAQYRGWRVGDIIHSELRSENGPDGQIRVMVA